ncbi:MAG: acetate kinase [Deltaproteobacteria bacterium]|nr:acetate kinase [Deltaproteobacteria bacterium]
MPAAPTLVLSLNAGSSSLKFDLFGFPGGDRIVSGSVDRLGSDRSELQLRVVDENREVRRVRLRDHRAAVLNLAERLRDHGGIPVTGIAIVGHRIVHGSNLYVDPVKVTAEVERDIASLAPLAPLHQPASLDALRAARSAWPDAVQVACFDTAFHAKLPPAARYYAIPLELGLRHGIRRYGFHGISHSYLAAEAARLLGRPLARLRIVTCHLGAGCSLTAVKGGRSIDTTMGYSPLEGLPMQTRSGDIDPAAVARIAEVRGWSLDETIRFLNTSSGLRGVSGTSGDMRDVMEERRKGHEPAEIAIDIYTGRIRKTIGAYAAAMGGLDAVVFSGGVGENQPEIRSLCCAGLEFLGIGIQSGRNRRVAGPSQPHDISTDNARVRTLVIPTDESLSIARQAWALAG